MATSRTQGFYSTCGRTPACDSEVSLPDVLNYFYTWFKTQNDIATRKTSPTPNDHLLCMTITDVRKIQPTEGCQTRQHFNRLAGNTTISTPKCFKAMTIIPEPKKSSVSCLSDYRPITPTPIVMKCFDRLIIWHITSQLPPHCIIPTTQHIMPSLHHLALTHLDKKKSLI